MKRYFTLLGIFFFFSFSSFTLEKDCEYAGSNIGYVKRQTQKAIDSEDLNTSRFFAYRALNAIEKSKEQFDSCGCDYAIQSINEALDNLKNATRVTSLNGTKLLLEKALENALGSLEALQAHDEQHVGPYGNDVLVMNTLAAKAEKIRMTFPVGKKLEQKIDSSLINYENSLEKVVLTVDCKEAFIFAQGIYDHCEQQLLKGDLTEAKKYYNLRVKNITAAALEKLGECN